MNGSAPAKPLAARRHAASGSPSIELEAARARRDALLERIRDGHRSEREAAGRLAERRSALLERVRGLWRSIAGAVPPPWRTTASGCAEGGDEGRVETGAPNVKEARVADARERSKGARGKDAGPAADDRARSEPRDRPERPCRRPARPVERRPPGAAGGPRGCGRAATLPPGTARARTDRAATRGATGRRETSGGGARRGGPPARGIPRETTAGDTAERAEAGPQPSAACDVAMRTGFPDRHGSGSPAARAAHPRRASTGRTRARDPRRRPETFPSRSTEPSGPGREPLDDPIPSGALSGLLPWLRVDGTRIVTIAGHPVTLRGVNVAGLGPPACGHDLAAGGMDEPGLEALVELGVGTVRVPIDRDRLLVGAGEWSALDHLVELDRIVEQVASSGAYTVLSLRTLGDTTFGTLPDGSGGRVPNSLAPQPDYDCIGLWRALGQRYADEPAVLFDLFAAPHAALPDDLTGMDADWDRWSLWVRLAVAELHRTHPRAVCLVTGLDWGTDLDGFPILGTANEPVPNLVYAATISADRPEPPLRALARRLPVLVTELDAPATAIAARAAGLAALGIGWIATARPDRPFVVPGPGGRIDPSVLGSSIRRAIATIPGRPLVEPPWPSPTALAPTV